MNVCENFFSVLTKFSHGKRKNGDFTDTWRVQCLVVCGLISNPNFVNEIMESMGVSQNEIRTKSIEKLNALKIYQKSYHANERQKNRRSLLQQVRQHALGKVKSSKNRHKTDKVKPSETVDSNRPKIKKKKNKIKSTKCGNCAMIGHSRNECVEAVSKDVSKIRQKTKM